jgi:hypothetical protein
MNQTAMERKTVEGNISKSGKKMKRATSTEDKKLMNTATATITTSNGLPIMTTLTSIDLKEFIEDTIRSVIRSEQERVIGLNVGNENEGNGDKVVKLQKCLPHETNQKATSIVKKSELLFLKNSLKNLESESHNKFLQLEQNVSALKFVMDDLQRTVILSNEKWEKEFKRFSDEIIDENILPEKKKTSKLLHKIYSKHENDLTVLRGSLAEIKQNSALSIDEMKEDMQAFSKQISKSKDQLDNL